MGKSYFSCKKFILHQDACIMKITEDACIQGAWTTYNTLAKNILDIGSGTGILSAMQAQQHANVHITSVELDVQSHVQGKENLEAAQKNIPFTLHTIQGNIKETRFENTFDIIICNPPFYEQQLPSNDAKKNMAWHASDITLQELLPIAKNNLNEQGIFSILLPNYRKKKLIELCTSQKMSVQKLLHIHHSADKEPHRIVGIITNNASTSISEEHLYIREKNNRYTSQFEQLMKPYYLIFT